MAPATNGLSVFNLSSKNTAPNINKNVSGDMVMKTEGKSQIAATAGVKVVDAPLAELNKSDTKQQEAGKSDAGADRPAAQEPTAKPAPAPAAPPVPAAAMTVSVPSVPAGKPAPVAMPLAAEAAAVAAAKDTSNGTSSLVIPKPAEIPTLTAAPAAPAQPANAAASAIPPTPPVTATASNPPPAPVPAPKPASKLRATAPPAAPKPQTAPEPVPSTKIRAEDAHAAWQTRPRVPVRLLDSYVNFMVVGESGLGKTTFIRNLVSSYTKVNKPHDGSTTSLASFQSDPDSLKTVLEPMEVREAGRRVHVTVQDMPGWADDINLVFFLRIMVNFILQQRSKDYEALAGGRALNMAAMCGQLQNSITACVYFLTPHRLKKVDLIIMSALSQLVTVIPVIAKADTMTESELADYRHEIRIRLSHPSKFVHNKSLAPLVFSNFSFEDEVMAQLGLRHEAWPLAIITSNKQEPIADRALLSQLGLSQTEVEQPVREYKWGSAYALNREHSDLIMLKRLLLGDRVDSLYAMLDESYLKYVAFCEQYEEAGKQLPLVVQDELAAASYLEYDDYSNAKSALDAAQQAMSTLMAENKVLVERLQTLEREKSSGGGAVQRRFSAISGH